MVHTRGKGARPEGFSEYDPPKREKPPRYISTSTSTSSPAQGPLMVNRAARAVGARRILAPTTANASTQTAVKTRAIPTQTETNRDPKSGYTDASTQTEHKLTCTCKHHVVPTSAKRRREVEENADQSASKRRKAINPEQPKFLFSKTRNRSILTSAPPKLSSRHESPYYRHMVEPASPESSPTARRTGSEERTRPRTQEQQQPETPSRNAPQGGLFGSVRRMFGYLRGGPAQVGAGTGEQEQRGNAPAPNNDTTANHEEENGEVADQGSPSPTPRRLDYEPESPTPETDLVDSRIFTREHFKRRRTANTIAGREQLAAMDEASFNPTSTPQSNKRKLASVDGFIPGPKSGGFGVDDSYLDVENDVEGIGESSSRSAQPNTPVNNRPPLTPLRSALRQPHTGNNFGTIGRSGKSVRINSVPTSAKAVYGQYGPAGDYRGSTFADISPQGSQTSNTPSSLAWDVKNMHSPGTLRNTFHNTPYRFDPNLRDPSDENWKPTAANPRPGHFVLPDFDDDDDEEEVTNAITPTQGQDEVPAQPPSTPRMSHAELPPSPVLEQSGLASAADSSLPTDTQETRLEKARSEAQKYKPARSSRLSLTEQARSRSSSPPGNDSTWRESQIEVSDTPGLKERRSPRTPDDTTMLSAAPVRSLSRDELDDTVVGEDNMTDYQREHQFDSWAEDIFNNIPAQSYTESGVATSYVENLVQKTWTERDTRESIEFWEKEFEEGLKAAVMAREEGRELVWITDPDEIIELEQKGY